MASGLTEPARHWSQAEETEGLPAAGPGEAGCGGESLPCLFVLTATVPSKSYLARKAETLFQNLEDMIARNGISRVGFVTLTFVENLTDREEAQRRFHSLSAGFLAERLLEWVCAVERQQRGAIHFHLICAFPFDIREGFDFTACSACNAAKKRGDFGESKRLERIYFASANPALRGWWTELREAAGRYGFGRCETLPILSNSEGLARYVGSYVGTEVANRELRDKRMRTLRYSLARRAASADWSWCAGGGRTWRMGCAVLGTLLRTDDFSEALGKRWAWGWREQISAFGRHAAMAMEAVKDVSDHYDFEERVVRAGRLFALIQAYELKFGKEA